jgi:hypothetical protein
MNVWLSNIYTFVIVNAYINVFLYNRRILVCVIGFDIIQEIGGTNTIGAQVLTGSADSSRRTKLLTGKQDSSLGTKHPFKERNYCSLGAQTHCRDRKLLTETADSSLRVQTPQGERKNPHLERRFFVGMRKAYSVLERKTPHLEPIYFSIITKNLGSLLIFRAHTGDFASCQVAESDDGSWQMSSTYCTVQYV